MSDLPNLAPTQVGPNTLVGPTAEERAKFAAYLRGIADLVENPDRLGLPIRTGTIDFEANELEPEILLPDPIAITQRKIGQQVKITVGWGTPKFGWDWR